jgi:hypothetical protein
VYLCRTTSGLFLISPIEDDVPNRIRLEDLQTVYILSTTFLQNIQEHAAFIALGSDLNSYSYSFCVHHPVKWDDRHLLEHAMASDFSVTWQYSHREQLIFLRIKHPGPQG